MPLLTFRARIILVAVVAIAGLFRLVNWSAAYIWFDALGYGRVFLTIQELKVGLFLCGFVPVFIYFWINFRIVSKSLNLQAVASALSTQLSAMPSGVLVYPSPAGDHGDKGGQPRAAAPDLLILVALIIGLLFGLVWYGEWDTLLRFWWSRAYGEADPIYGRDIGFYLFEVPFLELLQNSLLAASLLASALLFLGYSYAGAVHVGWGRGVAGSPAVLRHIAVNLSLFLVALAWGHYLDRFDLLLSSRGAVHGAGFTDVHVVVPTIWVLIAVALGLAAILLIPWFLRKGAVALVVLGGYLAILIFGLAIIPGLVQSFLVEPNELKLETRFLLYNIAFTREAYQLDQVTERSYSALKGITPAALTRNKETIDNIRVWDWRPLSESFRQLQQIRTYYEFGDVDVDRYRIGDAYRQVMLAARELSDTLPDQADTWVNRHLQYTHGYGLAMSLTAKMNAQGGPVLVVRDLPPRSASGLSVTQPAIYYGENMSGHRIVTTSVREFDHPKGDENIYTSYGGRGGITLDAYWKRLLFAWHQSDVNILITSYITPQSRIQFWRNVQERVQRLAPFLRLDKDPYAVISEGRLYWIQDAYTVSSLFPYSKPHGGEFNYIRNSVKAVVDAYNGDVVFYVMDSQDPVLGVYREAFPALFSDLEDMPDDLRRHLRYPPDLFEAQIQKYNVYHMTVPQVFYNAEDLWAVPREKYGGEVIHMKPYYVLMKLPEEAQLQFLLITPLTPANRNNMIAWLAARSDFPDYGELIVYKLPKERLIVGPMQVEAMIDQDTLISQQLSLWDQRGSRVVRGNLLVIPIEQSLIYVEPVYLIAEDYEIPQLKRVIVSNGERLAMEPTLEAALQAVFGTLPRPTTQTPAGEDSDRLSRARESLGTAEEALREGDWDRFGRAMEKLKGLLSE